MFWAPLAVLVLWSAGYVLVCYAWITSPGKAAYVVLPTRGGNVTLHAESFAFDARLGFLRAVRVRLTDPEGQRLAFAKELNLRLPASLGGSANALILRVVGGDIQLEREPDGQVRLLKYLPEKTEEPSQLPYRIDLERTVVRVLDRASPDGWRTSLWSEKLAIDGLGESFVATGDLRLARHGGSLRGTLRVDPENGARLLAELQALELADALKSFAAGPEGERWPQLRDLAAKRITASGKLEAELSKAGAMGFRAEFEASAEAIRFGDDYYADSTSFTGVATEAGASGKGRLAIGGAEFVYEGAASWQKGFSASLDVRARADSLASAPTWIRTALPEGLSAEQPAFSGRVRWDELAGIGLAGEASARSARFKGETVREPRLALVLGNGRLVAEARGGNWLGQAPKAVLSVNLRTGEVRAWARGDRLDLALLADRFDFDRLGGYADVTATIGGTLDAPDIVVRARGEATLRIRDGESLPLGEFQVLARGDGDSFRVPRLALFGGPGTATGAGSFNLSTRAVRGNAFLSGFDLSSLGWELEGSSAASIQLSGTMESPQLYGTAELYGVSFRGQDLPLVTAKAGINLRRLAVDEWVASRGSAIAKGRIAWEFGTDGIEGEFSARGIQLSEILGGGEGSVELRDGKVSGTSESPLASARFGGQDLAVAGVKVDFIEGALAFRDRTLFAERLSARTGDGALTGSAWYDLEAGVGEASGTASGVSLAEILPKLPGDTLVGGVADADFKLEFGEAGLSALIATGGVRDLTVNPTNLGSGSWRLTYGDGAWGGWASLGRIERYIELSEVAYRPESEALAGEIVAYDLPLRDLYLAVRPYFVPDDSRERQPILELPQELVEQLDAIEGRFDADIRAEGSVRNIGLRLQAVHFRDLKVRGTPSGDIKASGARGGGVWTIENLRWTNGETVMSVAGVVDEHGDVALDGELKNLRTDWLASFEPSFARLRGRGDVSFLVQGSTRSPVITGSAGATLFEPERKASEIEAAAWAGQPEQNPRLVFEMDTFEVREGSAEVHGVLSYLGFKVGVDGRLPFAYPGSLPAEGPLDVRVNLKPRDISELKDLFSGIDTSRTSGKLGGDIRIGGTPSQTTIRGEIAIADGALALEGLDTYVRSLNFAGSISEGSLSLRVSGEGSRGGSFEGEARLSFPGPDEPIFRSFDPILNSPVNGRLAISGIRARENWGTRGAADFEANGVVFLSGTLRQPLVSADEPLALRSVTARAPSVFGERRGEWTGPIEPRLRVPFSVGAAQDPAEIAAGAGLFKVAGSGLVTGSLAAPNVSATFAILGGAIRLPTTRIAIEEGGEARLAFRGDPASPEMRLDVDMSGTTSLTALQYSGLAQRYEIRLQIRGNLLEEGQLQFFAQSDPPDLSQERILAMLGQSQLVESLDPRTADELEQRLGTALSYAVPLFLDPYTEQFAREIGLDFLAVEYNPIEGPTVTAAKSLARGLVLQYRRQLAEGPDGQLRVELKLTYRPFAGRRILRNVVTSVGMDNRTPYKITLEYGIRF